MTVERIIKITVDGVEAQKTVDDLGQKSKVTGRKIDKVTKALNDMLSSSTKAFHAAVSGAKSFNQAISSSAYQSFNTVLKRTHTVLTKLVSAFKTLGSNLKNLALKAVHKGLDYIKKSLNGVISRFRKWGNDIRKHPIKHLSKTIRSINNGLHFMAARFAALVVGFSSIVKANNMFTNFHATMMTVVKDAKAVDKEWNYIVNTANRLGVNIEGVIEPFSRLRAALAPINPSGEAARAIFEGVSTAAVVLHKSVADTNLVFLAMEQVASKGKVSLEELQKQFAQKVPGAMAIAAKAAGFGQDSMAQFFKAVRNGTIDVSDFMKKFGKGLKDTYGAGLVVASKSFQAISNRLHNMFTIMKVDLSQNGFIQGLNNLMKTLTDKLAGPEIESAIVRLSEKFGELFDVVTNWVGTITSKDIASAINVITSAVGSTKTILADILGMAKGSTLVDMFSRVTEMVSGIATTIFNIIKKASDFLGVAEAHAAGTSSDSTTTQATQATVSSKIVGAVEILGNSVGAWADLISNAVSAVANIKIGDPVTHGQVFGPPQSPLPGPNGFPNRTIPRQPGVNSVVEARLERQAVKFAKDVSDKFGSVLNVNTAQSVALMERFKKRANSFEARAGKTAQDPIVRANIRRKTALSDINKQLADVSKEVTRVGDVFSSLSDKEKAALGRVTKIKRASLIDRRHDLEVVRARIVSASKAEVAQLQVAEAKKADVVKTSFDKLLASRTNNFALELDATRASLKKRFEEHVKFASDKEAFTKSFNAAQLRAIVKFGKDSAKVGRSTFTTDLRRTHTARRDPFASPSDNAMRDATRAFSATNKDLNSREVKAKAGVPQDLLDRQGAIAEVERKFNEERLFREKEFNNRKAEINAQAFDEDIQNQQNRQQASLDLKQSFSDLVSSNQQANLGGMASALETFSGTIFSKEEKIRADGTKFNKFKVKDEAETWKGKLSIAGGAMKAMSGLMNSGNKKLFMLGKAAAMGSATVDTFMAVNKALASAPPPFNFALAAIVGAAGIANVAKIASTPFGGASAKPSVPSGGGGSGGRSAVGGSSGGTTPQPLPAKPVTQITIINQGNVLTQDFIDNNIVPHIKDRINNHDVIFIQPGSAQHQALAVPA